MTRFVPVVDRVFPLDAADAALRHMEAGAPFGKIGLALRGVRLETPGGFPIQSGL